MKKRLISLSLTFLFLFSLLPAFALTAQAAESVTNRNDGVWFYPVDAQYAVSDWAGCTGWGPCKFHNVNHYGDSAHNDSFNRSLGHQGIDIAAAYVPVYASRTGVVRSICYFGASGRGTTIALEHAIGNGYSFYSIYQHLSGVNVSEGQSVSMGNRIATSGNHMHFAILLAPSNTYMNNTNINAVEGRGWVTQLGDTQTGRIVCNPSSSSDPVLQRAPGAVKEGLLAHMGSVRYTFEAVSDANVSSALTNPFVYNAKYYRDSYPDLQKAFGSDEKALLNHWLTCGIKEGRCASPCFDAAWYLEHHPDVAKVFGATNYAGAIEHFITYGIKEGRRASPCFDAAWYLEHHPDVAKVFGATNYAGAIEHFITYGIAEGRMSSSEFNVKVYKENFIDLQRAFGDDNAAYFIHYIKYGKDEGRLANERMKAFFDPNGGTCSVESKIITSLANYGELPVAQKDGYSFLGWYTSKDGGTKITSDTQVKNVFTHQTLYAHWGNICSNGHNYVNGVCTRCGEKDSQTPSTPVPSGKEVHFTKVTTYFQGQFSDVPANQWFTNNVSNAFSFGLMKGNSSTTFNPYGDVTIAEAIAMAARIHSIYTTGTENFAQGTPWYQCYLDYAYQNKIISYAYYNCDVKHKATRAQFAEIFSAALPDEALSVMNNVADNAVPDVKMKDSYSAPVYKLYRAGILAGGDAKGTFSPATFITRAECATIVARMADSDNRVSFSLT